MKGGIRKDITGNRYGRLTVISYAGKRGGNLRWLCRCDCGIEKTIAYSCLSSGASKSCGCLQRELTKKRNYKHGLTNTRLHITWFNMKARCYNEKNNRFRYYGAKGITVCDEWRNDFKAFYDWAMANGYREDLTIDRHPNKAGNYEPSNCRWISKVINSRDKRSTLLNPARVRVIFNLQKIGFTHKKISELYMVAEATVQNVLKNDSWKSVDGSN